MMMMEGVEGVEVAVNADLTHEETILTRQVELLEVFLDKNQDALPLPHERCRLLRQRIEVMETALSRAGKIDDARTFLELHSLPNQPGQEAALQYWPSSRDSYPGSLLFPLNANDPQPKYPQRVGSNQELESTGGAQSADEASSDIAATSKPPKRIRNVANETAPCLRCRVLKKKCDSLDECRHCPHRNFDNESDYWRVLGCHRGPLKGLSGIFCPDYTRRDTRRVRKLASSTETILLNSTHTQLVSNSELRIMQLVDQMPEFQHLTNSAWENERVSLSIKANVDASSSRGLGPLQRGNNTINEFEVPWYLLLAISVEPSYLGKTEYNFFQLIRAGNQFSRIDPIFEDLFSMAKRLLREAVKLLLSERKILDCFKGPDSASYFPAKFASVDLRRDVENFLEHFETVCSGRGKLCGFAQLACLYALLVFNVAKTVMIDAYLTRNEYEVISLWQDTDAVRIASAYKAIVSVYGWASKSDVIDSTMEMPPNFGSAILETQEMLHQSMWEQRGYKATKDFLIALGSSFLLNGAYNGFLVPKFRSSQIARSLPKTASMSTLEPGKHPNTSTHLPGGPSHMADLWVSDPGKVPYLPISKASTTIDHTTEKHDSAPWNQLDQKGPKYKPDESWSSKTSPSGTHSTFQLNIKADDKGENLGRRRGKLDRETKRKAARVRQIKACWSCWLLKVPCSEGEVCERCLKHGPHDARQICTRFGLVDYVLGFFPDVLYSPFTKQSISRYLDTYNNRFRDNSLEIEVTWNGLCTTKISVHEYIPKTEDPLRPYLQMMNKIPELLESAPVGIMAMDTSGMKKTYLRSCRTTLANEELPSIITSGHSTTMGRRIVSIILSFYRSTDSPLIRSGTLLYLASHCLNRTINFAESSVLLIRERIQGVILPSRGLTSRLLTSRLLDLQVKVAVSRIAWELAVETLEGLEKCLRSRTKDGWSFAFCTILLLCMCVEEIQIAAVASIGIGKPDGTEAPTIYAALSACQGLEDLLANKIPVLFHDIYKTNKQHTAGISREGGYNPLRQTFVDDNPSLNADEPTQNMVKKFNGMIREFYKEMRKLDRPPNFGAEPEVIERENRGRLVSKFLLSFLDNKLNENGKHQVCIQFISFGKDVEALKQLDEVDDKLGP